MTPDNLRAALAHAHKTPPQSAEMLDALRSVLDFKTLRPAAVLIPLIAHPDGLHVLFTERSAGLASHGGEYSFPGGRLDPEDRNTIDCALRETEEEVGLPRASVEVLGELTPYIVRTGYHVTPIVGLIRPPFKLMLEVGEVAEAFEIPLADLANPDLPEYRPRRIGTTRVPIPHLPLPDRLIWGATAGMMINFLAVTAALRESREA